MQAGEVGWSPEVRRILSQTVASGLKDLGFTTGPVVNPCMF
jgi:hypothetical protein